MSGALQKSHPSSESADFQVKVGQPRSGVADGPTPCVLVMTRAHDPDVDSLSVRLAAAGIALLRLDSDRCAEQEISWDPSERVLTTAEGSFRPLVGWGRYFSARSIPAPGDLEVAAYRRDQWSAWPAIPLAADGIEVINRGASATSPDRVTQIAAAQAAGLRTPATIVTNSPSTAARLLPGSGEVMAKALGEHFVEPRPGHCIGLLPRRLSRSELIALESLEPAPVLFQEFIPSREELRVHAVGGELITYAVTKPSPESLWMADSRVDAREVPTPAEIEGPLTHLARMWNLDVAAFDLLASPEGLVFLEVNPTCSWFWCERSAGSDSITGRVTELVSTLFDKARSNDARSRVGC
jgi:glutathione synthase/RimK-type ligase-like ATP-grasp enzyme